VTIKQALGLVCLEECRGSRW